MKIKQRAFYRERGESVSDTEDEEQLEEEMLQSDVVSDEGVNGGASSSRSRVHQRKQTDKANVQVIFILLDKWWWMMRSLMLMSCGTDGESTSIQCTAEGKGEDESAGGGR